jgi:hypothetical protein
MPCASRIALACLAASALAGCALSSEQVREANRRTEVASGNPPVNAIDCVVRKAEEGRSGLVGRIRDAGTSGRYEAAIWRLDNTVVVVEAAPAATGSTLTVFQNPNTLDSAAADLMARMKGC